MYQLATEISRVKAAVLKRDGGCVDCGLSVADHIAHFGCKPDIHRKIPGSLYTTRGCETVCRPCHGKKLKRPRGSLDKAKPPMLAAGGTPAHYRALRKLTATTRHSMSVQILIAIEEMLAKHNLWPPESGK